VKILMVNYEYPPLGGGGGVTHALVAEELAKRHKVAVLTSAFGDLPSYEVRNGVEIHRVRVWNRRDKSVASLGSLLTFPPAALFAGAGIVSRESFDILNAHFAVPTGPVSVPLARMANVPHVMSVHGGDIYDPSKRLSPHRVPSVRRAVTWVLNHSDAVVAQSTNTRENTYRYTGYTGPVELIPLGIRKPEVTSATRAALGLPEGFLAVTVGRLVSRKGVHHLLDALARPECESIHLAIVGAGPELDPLRATADRLGVGPRVTFTGWVEDIRKWQILECADAYVSSTMHEGFGLVYLEAMAAGLPVITSDHGGQVDFLRDGENGYLVRPSDDAAIAHAIGRLLADPEARRRMRETNLRDAQEHRSERCARAYELLFDRLAGAWMRRSALATAETKARSAPV
jgi:glycosyltransferase involved in cell wall biosynthesis